MNTNTPLAGREAGKTTKPRCPECGCVMEVGRDEIAKDWYAQCRNQKCSFDGWHGDFAIATHSPVPWTIHGESIKASDPLVPNCLLTVAMVHEPSDNKKQAPGTREANARLIVQAVNAHADLLEALKDILAAYHGLTLGRQDTEREGQFKVKARAAIAKATNPNL